jgi:hypothetical protein
MATRRSAGEASAIGSTTFTFHGGGSKGFTSIILGRRGTSGIGGKPKSPPGESEARTGSRCH